MSNNYKYLDPDYVYTDPVSGVLRNIAGIIDQKALVFAETAVVTKRAGELFAKPIRINDSSALFAIHQHLFQDIYTWAGKKRTVEISKGGKQFFPTARFDRAFVFIDSLILDYKHINKDDQAGIADKLAEILDTVNYLHPFREGNGRTQREFLRLLAAEKGWKLNLTPPDDKKVYERYMTGTINSDVAALTGLMFERLNK